MKQIIALSLSTLGLAALIFVLQGRPDAGQRPMGALLMSEKTVPGPDENRPNRPAANNRVGATAVVPEREKVPPPAAERPSLSKSERLKKIVRELPWDEARPEVIKVLNEGGRAGRPSTTGEWRKDNSVREEQWRGEREEEEDDDDDN